MGEYTPNLNLYKPKADFPAERGWGTKYNEAMDILDGCAKKEYVDGFIAKVFPYRPETWPTETLDWGDIPAGNPSSFEGILNPHNAWITVKTFVAPPGNSYTWRFTIVTSTSASTADFRITANGVDVYNVEGHGQGTLTVDKVIPAGSTVAIQGYNNRDYGYGIMSSSSVQNLGVVSGPKTFNLSGKWLALGLDMKGLAATVKIQGVEMPYSDYVKYFPLAPSELTIPGGWDASQVRPVIKVYNI